MLHTTSWALVAAAKVFAGFSAAVLFILYYFMPHRYTRTASCSAK